MVVTSLTVDSPAPAPLFAQMVLDSLPDLVAYLDADQRYRLVNQAYHAWYGLDPAEIVGLRLRDIIGEESYRLAEPYLNQAFAGELTTFTALMPFKYGPPRRVEARLIPDRTGDGEVSGLFTVVRDISHHERIQQEVLTVLDGMDACFLALDPDGRVTFMNTATERFLAAAGLEQLAEREFLYGKRPWDLKPEAQGGPLHRAFNRVRATSTPEAFEFTPIGIPGRIVDMRVFPTPSGSVGFSFIDVTERRRAEDELRRGRERLRIALDAGGMAVFEFDSLTGQTWFSDNIDKVLGRAPPATALADHVHPDDRARVLAAQEHVLSSGEPCDLTIRSPSPVEGEWLWLNVQATRALDASGRPVRLVGMVRDVTRAHIADEVLRAANVDLEARIRNETAERLQAVLDRERFWSLSRDLYAVITRGEGRIRRINAPAWKAVLGYDSDQLVGLHLNDLIHPDDLEASRAEVAKLATAPTIELEYRIRHADGGWRWMHWKVITDAGFSYAAGRDVTEDKAREEQVRRTQKLEALGQLTGGVAHDFNNLLTVIMGALDLVQKHPQDAGRCEQLISAALVAAKRGERLNRQLLGFARRQASHREFVCPGARLEEMAPLVRGALNDAIALELDTAGEGRGVMADPTQFEVAVLNLVVNARDAMPDGGALRLSVHAAPPQEVGRLSLPPGDYLVLDVRDTGAGMSEEVLAHVFEPFFTTKEVGKGSGLGLAQVYGFARQCGGTADIRTEEGLGTTVSVFLPASAPPPAVEEPEAPKSGAVPQTRILLVEDDVLVGAVTEGMLADMGHLVTRAEDAAGARVALARGEFDLLFTDVRMPGGCNGVQLAREATAARPGMKVLLCSGWTDVELDKEGLGATWPLLAKPFDVNDLERALKGVLAGP
jgi:PAS domain S-box-containing protein